MRTLIMFAIAGVSVVAATGANAATTVYAAPAISTVSLTDNAARITDGNYPHWAARALQMGGGKQ